MLFALRVPLELVLQRLERAGLEAVQAVGNGGHRPVDLDLTRVVDAMRGRRGAVGVSGVDGRIERLERVERAVGHHRNALLGVAGTSEGSAVRRRNQDVFRPLTPATW